MNSKSGPEDRLRRWISAEVRQPVSTPVAALVEAIASRHGRAVAAVLFYGSCMRRPDPLVGEDPVFDFYVVVDRYRDIFRNPMLALANWIVPPNVFYLEIPWHGRVLRAKYAVMSSGQLRRRVGGCGFHPYFWARLSQPMRLTFVRSEETHADVINTLQQAVKTLVERSIGLMPARFSSRDLWIAAYRETYRTELRAEGPDRSTLIYEGDPARFDAFAEEILLGLGVKLDPSVENLGFARNVPSHSAIGTSAAWLLRRMIGKPLSIVRLIKGAVTFDGGTQYILWKIERHSGIKADRSPWESRHPILSAPRVAWRLFRQGAFR